MRRRDDPRVERPPRVRADRTHLARLDRAKELRLERQSEIADLVYHLSVLMVDEGMEWRDVYEELERRS